MKIVVLRNLLLCIPALLIGFFANSQEPTFTQSSAIPLEYSSIKGWTEQRQNRIEFTTLDLHETKQFVIERSLDGKIFESIGRPTSNSTRATAFRFIDNYPPPSAFYRVCGLNNVERPVYSEIIRINQGATKLTVINQPGSTSLLFANAEPRIAYLYSFSGQLIQEINMPNNRHTISHNELKKGMYVLQLNGQALKIMVL